MEKRVAHLLNVAINGTDVKKLETACKEAELVGIDENLVSMTRRRAQIMDEATTLEKVADKLEPLIEAVKNFDATAMTPACNDAESAGLSDSAVQAVRRRIRQVREAELLAAAVHGADRLEKESGVNEALASGVDEEEVAMVRDWAQQSKEVHLIIACLLGDKLPKIEGRTSSEATTDCATLFSYTYDEHLDKPFFTRLEEEQVRTGISKDDFFNRLVVKDVDWTTRLYREYFCIKEAQYPVQVFLKVSADALAAAKWNLRPLIEKQMLAEAVLGRSSELIKRACDEAALVGVFSITIEASRKKTKRLRNQLTPELERELDRVRKENILAVEKGEGVIRVLKLIEEQQPMIREQEQREEIEAKASRASPHRSPQHRQRLEDFLPPSPQHKLLEDHLSKLMNSGYSQKMRKEYMKCTDHRKETMRELKDSGQRMNKMGDELKAWTQVLKDQEDL